jgi:hypothetical protein
VVKGADSKIVELHRLGVVLMVMIPGSEVAGRQRGTRIGGRRLEYDNARVDEAGTCGQLPDGGMVARRGGLPVT